MKKHGLQTALGILGLALLALGLYLVKTTNATEGILLTLPYVFVGIGSGLFGQGMGGVIERRVLKKNPEILKQKEIEVNDERNQQISNRAKAKAYDIIIFIFGALMVFMMIFKPEGFWGAGKRRRNIYKINSEVPDHGSNS